MTGCTATGNGGHGISARTSSATITGCYSWGNLWNSLIISHPIEPSTKGARATITGNIFGGSTAPPADEVQITGLDNVVFTGNLVEGSNITDVPHFSQSIWPPAWGVRCRCLLGCLGGPGPAVVAV